MHSTRTRKGRSRKKLELWSLPVRQLYLCLETVDHTSRQGHSPVSPLEKVLTTIGITIWIILLVSVFGFLITHSSRLVCISELFSTEGGSYGCKAIIIFIME